MFTIIDRCFDVAAIESSIGSEKIAALSSLQGLADRSTLPKKRSRNVQKASTQTLLDAKCRTCNAKRMDSKTQLSWQANALKLDLQQIEYGKIRSCPSCASTFILDVLLDLHDNIDTIH